VTTIKSELPLMKWMTVFAPGFQIAIAARLFIH
jgi:hypothetical protein